MIDEAGGASFGGFSIGALQLALPMAALREVVPLTALVALPCRADFVVGGIGLRGVVIPVVDLRRLLGLDAGPATTRRNVVVMVHGSRLVGLLVDTVTGIFDAVADSCMRVTEAGGAAEILLACVQRHDTREPVSVLSAAGLASLPLLPMVADPEPSRQALAAEAGTAPGSGTDTDIDADSDNGAGRPATRTVPMLLLRCGDVPFAVAAVDVHATLSDPQVKPSALASAHCRGVIVYDGRKVAALDLLSLCGWGRLPDSAARRAFVIRLPAGDVAFLVSEVVDVVHTAASDVKKVPALALPRAAFFAGALPAEATGAELGARAHATPYLIIDAAALTGSAEVGALAGLNVDDDNPSAPMPTAAAADAAGQRAMITYLLNTERATPLDQVAEILPYQAGIETFRMAGPMRGLMMNRGRSIPVLCLAESIGEPGLEPTGAFSVLVVKEAGELIGFAVPALKSIEHASWEPALPGTLHAPAGSNAARASRPLAMVGEAGAHRMLPVIHLGALAREFQALATAG